jgi:acid stress-induced BolA-like protein IbaG/YrbA
MDEQQIKAVVLEALPGTEIDISGDGRHFDMVIVGSQFEGARTVKRQQMVYGILNEHITSGAIHALNIRAFTPEEWAARA